VTNDLAQPLPTHTTDEGEKIMTMLMLVIALGAATLGGVTGSALSGKSDKEMPQTLKIQVELTEEERSWNEYRDFLDDPVPATYQSPSQQWFWSLGVASFQPDIQVMRDKSMENAVKRLQAHLGTHVRSYVEDFERDFHTLIHTGGTDRSEIQGPRKNRDLREALTEQIMEGTISKTRLLYHKDLTNCGRGFWSFLYVNMEDVVDQVAQSSSQAIVNASRLAEAEAEVLREEMRQYAGKKMEEARKEATGLNLSEVFR
jgi:hypothetical protein